MMDPALDGVTRRSSLRMLQGRSSAGSPYQRRLQSVVTLMLLVVITEGLLRRLLPPLSLPIFFLKDFLVALAGLMLLFGNSHRAVRVILGFQAAILLLVSPCVVSTAMHDPLLALFGLKQYDLYPLAGAALCAAYLPGRKKEFLSFCHLVACTIIPTASLALLQQRLPAEHWLNKSPDGESLERFSAGGQLRVSSSFSFVSQFCMYLNALIGYLGITAFSRIKLRRSYLSALNLALLLLPFYFLAIYSTGSRQAVLGGGLIVLTASLVLGISRGRKHFPKLLLGGIASLLLLGGLRLLNPQGFQAYDARTPSVEGVDSTGSTGAAVNRVTKALSNWVSEAISGPFFGNGLGVMSNGTDKFSNYAAVIRSEGFWTETDPATVVYEGGIYLIVIWYGVRLVVILWGLVVVLRIRDPALAAAGAFCWGPLVVIGFLGTLSIQPPLSIWWWVDFGLILCLREFDQESRYRRFQPTTHAGHLR